MNDRLTRLGSYLRQRHEIDSWLLERRSELAAAIAVHDEALAAMVNIAWAGFMACWAACEHTAPSSSAHPISCQNMASTPDFAAPEGGYLHDIASERSE